MGKESAKIKCTASFVLISQTPTTHQRPYQQHTEGESLEVQLIPSSSGIGFIDVDGECQSKARIVTLGIAPPAWTSSIDTLDMQR